MRYGEGAVTGIRVWLAEEGSGTELAAQNHSCLDRFAVELSLPYITPPPGRNSGSERGLSVSPLLRVSQGGGIPPHTRKGVTGRRRGSCLHWSSLRTAL